MSEIATVSPFEALGTNLRFGVTEDGTPFVVLADIARLLGHRDAANAGRMLDEIEKGTQTVSTPGGDQRVSVAYEDGIWELVFRSQVEGAKAIKKRVKEILREIRQTGSYYVEPAPVALPTTREKILQKDRRPYQEYAAWFRVTIRQYDDSNGVPRPYVNARMYPAGALRLHALLTKRGRELRKPVFDNQLSLLNGGAA